MSQPSKRVSIVEWTGNLATFEQSLNNACALIEKTSGQILNIDVKQERYDKVFTDPEKIIRYRAFIIYVQS